MTTATPLTAPVRVSATAARCHDCLTIYPCACNAAAVAAPKARAVIASIEQCGTNDPESNRFAADLYRVLADAEEGRR